MAKLSIILPSYKEPYLNKTIESVLQNAESDIEVHAVLDGYNLDSFIADPRVQYIHLEERRLMRGAINAGLVEAKGDFVMKLAHYS